MGCCGGKKKGKNIYYRITNPKIIKAFGIIKEVLSEKLKMDKRLLMKSKNAG